MSSINTLLENTLVRLEDRILGNSQGLAIPDFMRKKTRMKNRPFSFKDHEFQIEIAKDPSLSVSVIKCSQVGLSELAVRVTLSYLAIRHGFTAIYVFPTRQYAMKFTKARIDPVIDGSAELTKLAKAGADGAELKQLGSSFLYISGSNTESQAISIAADMLVRDEYDFCDQTILGKYSSRLRHANEGKGGITRDFSTPTVSGYGIDEKYQASSKGVYMCKCKHCGEWQWPDFDSQVFIPGYDGDFKDFTRGMLTNREYDISATHIICSRCRKELDTSLADPSCREWVHQRDYVPNRGYSVSPLDLYKYNRPDRIVLQLSDYPLRSDYDNFVLGKTSDTDDNRINVSTVSQCTVGSQPGSAESSWMGIDVGNIIYVTIGRPNSIESNDYFAYFSIDSKKQEPIERIEELVKAYGVKGIVVDSNPDLTLVRNLVSKFSSSMPVNPAVYVEDSNRDINVFNLNASNVVNIKRTKAFNQLTEEINSGQARFTEGQHSREYKQHFTQMKRITDKTESGDQVQRWVKLSSEDHFLHSTLYCKTAIGIAGQVEQGAAPVDLFSILGATMNKPRDAGSISSVKETASWLGVI
jgi:hypothetical protein